MFCIEFKYFEELSKLYLCLKCLHSTMKVCKSILRGELCVGTNWLQNLAKNMLLVNRKSERTRQRKFRQPEIFKQVLNSGGGPGGVSPRNNEMSSPGEFEFFRYQQSKSANPFRNSIMSSESHRHPSRRKVSKCNTDSKPNSTQTKGKVNESMFDIFWKSSAQLCRKYQWVLPIFLWREKILKHHTRQRLPQLHIF